MENETRLRKASVEIIDIRKSLNSVLTQRDGILNDKNFRRITLAVYKEKIKESNGSVRIVLKELRDLHEEFVGGKQEAHYIANSTRTPELLDVIGELESSSHKDTTSDLEILSKRDEFKSSISLPDNESTLDYLNNMIAIEREIFKESINEYRRISTEMYEFENDVARLNPDGIDDYLKLNSKWYQVYKKICEYRDRVQVLSEKIEVISLKVNKHNNKLNHFYKSVTENVEAVMSKSFPFISYVISPSEEKTVVTLVGDVDSDISDYVEKVLRSEGANVEVIYGKLVEAKEQPKDSSDFDNIIRNRVSKDSLKAQESAAKSKIDELISTGFCSKDDERDYHFFPIDKEIIINNISGKKHPVISISPDDAEYIVAGDWLIIGTSDGKQLLKSPFIVNRLVDKNDGSFAVSLDRVFKPEK